MNQAYTKYQMWSSIIIIDGTVDPHSNVEM